VWVRRNTCCEDSAGPVKRAREWLTIMALQNKITPKLSWPITEKSITYIKLSACFWLNLGVGVNMG